MQKLKSRQNYFATNLKTHIVIKLKDLTSEQNMQIRVFAYFQFEPFPKLKIDSESRFEMKISIFLF